MKTPEEMEAARDVNDDPDEGLEPEGIPAGEDMEEGDEERDEKTDLPPAMPPGV